MTTTIEVRPDGRLLVHPETRADWRAWLAENHARREGIWLVAWRSGAGDRPRVSYEEQILEALCFGWVDSVVNTIDELRAAIWMSPRRRGSVWSRPNKLRVAQLEADGLMHDAGRAVIERARADGSWTVLDGAEDGIVPEDLAGALGAADAMPGWDAYSRSTRKGLIAWVTLAKRPQTRQKRIAEIVAAASLGIPVGASAARSGD